MNPIVFLQGFAGHGDCWNDVISRIPPRPTHAYELLGHDWQQPEAPLAQSFDQEVERLATRIRSDCRERARLCGYSMGGRVALVLLLRHPELFASAVLIGASPGLASEEERTTRAAEDAKWIELLSEQPIERFVDAWEAQPIFASQRRLDSDVLYEQRRRRIRHHSAGLASAMRILGLAAMPNVWPELRTIAMPVELVVGELDKKFLAIATEMRSEIPSSRLHVVAGAGHNVVLEQPDAVASIVARAPQR